MRYLTYFKSSLTALSLLFVLFLLPNTGYAQGGGPQGYCNPYSTCNTTTDRPGSQGGTIESVEITALDGTVILSNQTGVWQIDWDGDGNRCYNFFTPDMIDDGDASLTPGETYNIEIIVKSWDIRGWCSEDAGWGGAQDRSYPLYRYWIDWDANASFNQTFDDYYPQTEEWDEFLGYGLAYYPAMNPPCRNHTFTSRFTVPEDVNPVQTRLRVSATGGYSTPSISTTYQRDACYYYYRFPYSDCEDYLISFAMPIKDIYPNQNDVLFANMKYDGSTVTIGAEDYILYKPMIELRDVPETGTLCSYQIKGPLPGSGVVFTGLDPDGNSVFDLSDAWTANPLKFTFQNSTGSASPDDDGAMYFTNCGEYFVEIKLWLGSNPEPKVITKRFVVSFANDLSVSEIGNPVKFYSTTEKPYTKVYSRGIGISLDALYKNAGKNNIEKFEGNYTVHKATPVYSNGGEIVDYKYGTEVVNEIYEFDASGQNHSTLKPLDEIEISFGVFSPTETGVYIVNAYGKLQSAPDDESYNDRYPRNIFMPSEPNVWPYGAVPLLMFKVADEIESAALRSFEPAQGETMIVNRPFFPRCEVQNNGVSDISNAYGEIIFEHKTSHITVSTQMVIEDIPSGYYNKKTIKFTPVALPEPGEWVAKFTLSSQGDIIPENDVITWSFFVAQSIEGKFRVGLGQDFETIQEAMDNLYLYGMKGDIELILTDNKYIVSSPEAPEPPSSAWDLSTAIMGLGPQEDGSINTLTITPSDIQQVTYASTVIELHTRNGKGVYLGQDITNNSNNAIIKENLLLEQYNEYYNSQGYIIFDGGTNRSLKFELHSQSDVHGAVFYLNRGSHHITIENCILENHTETLKHRVYLPHVYHSDSDGFIFDTDSSYVIGAYDGYSAGIVSRGTLFDQRVVLFDENGNPVSDKGEADEERLIVLDTIPNSNNTFRSNEIRDFGYGIVSIGLGVLFNGDGAKYSDFSNENNIIEDNEIGNIARAGIFVGYEKGLIIKNNIVTGVTGSGNGIGVGIQIGSESRDKHLPYYNQEVLVHGNTINNISGTTYTNGIRFVQGFNLFVDPQTAFTIFPEYDSDIEIIANAIWGIESKNATADKIGIAALTERVKQFNENDEQIYSDYEVILNARFPELLIKDLEISNNTILMTGDFNNVDYANTGFVAGISTQSVKTLELTNNAVAIKESISSDAPIRSGLFLESLLEPALIDGNAYWLSDTDLDVIRHILSEPMIINSEYATGFIHDGGNGEYKELRQWRSWTGKGMNSIDNNDFTADYSTAGFPARLQIVSPTPMASVLNNRGIYLGGGYLDMNDLVRGTGGEPFDIGAIEFVGESYSFDGELVEITAPANYKATSGEFSETEYMMTDKPIEVEARVRNNGKNYQDAMPIIYTIERYDSGLGTAPFTEVIDTIHIEISPYESVQVPLGMADGIGFDFMPKTLAELDIPLPAGDEKFYGMEENISPIYKIKIAIFDDEDDEDGYNNDVSEKLIRFYMIRSGIKTLECNTGLNRNYENSADVDVLANNLNAKAIEAGLVKLGIYNVTRDEAAYNTQENNDGDKEYKQDIDRFNRNSWPSRSIDYTMYRTIFFSDGDNDQNLDRFGRLALNTFVNS